MMRLKFTDALELPDAFEPSDYDVICGWARQNYHHAGNRRLREIIAATVPVYIAAKTKSEKGEVIVEIFERICRDSPTGVGLVRLDPKSGRWSYIGTDKAKDKIGHALRKASQEQEKRMAKEGFRKRKVLHEQAEEQISSITPHGPPVMQYPHSYLPAPLPHAPHNPPHHHQHAIQMGPSPPPPMYSYPSPHHHPHFHHYHHPHHQGYVAMTQPSSSYPSDYYGFSPKVHSHQGGGYWDVSDENVHAQMQHPPDPRFTPHSP